MKQIKSLIGEKFFGPVFRVGVGNIDNANNVEINLRYSIDLEFRGLYGIMGFHFMQDGLKTRIANAKH